MLFAFNVQNASAQAYVYQAKFFAMNILKGNGDWSGWSDWEKSTVKVVIDFNNDVIHIHTDKKQTYVVLEYTGDYTDKLGGKQYQYKVIDQDGDLGIIRLRIEKNGNSQLYVEFADVILVYSGLVRLDLRDF